ncbi:DUF2202 domain-containing protein [Streptomyces sp. ADMS]|nr:DUF2202 domain-containing protein [Streptomyces sp. ADMS]MDW4905525.1 DUF2202 domain-containing protein [Streptomyces sp. ADMS]
MSPTRTTVTEPVADEPSRQRPVPATGYGRPESRDGNGPCSPTGTAAGTAPSGTLSAPQKTTLARVAEEEQLAPDPRSAFAARYDAQVVDRIVTAETRHLDAVRTPLDRYDATDPTARRLPVTSPTPPSRPRTTDC